MSGKGLWNYNGWDSLTTYTKPKFHINTASFNRTEEMVQQIEHMPSKPEDQSSSLRIYVKDKNCQAWWFEFRVQSGEEETGRSPRRQTALQSKYSGLPTHLELSPRSQTHKPSCTSRSPIPSSLRETLAFSLPSYWSHCQNFWEINSVLELLIVSFTQDEVTWGESTSFEKIPPSDYPVALWGHFLD